MVERATGSPKPKNPNRRGFDALRKYGNGPRARGDEHGAFHRVSGPLGSTFTEKPPVWTSAVVEVTELVETVELGNVEPHVFTPVETYALAFALYMVNILKGEEELREMGLKLSPEELKSVHVLVRPESEGRAKLIPAFDLEAVVIQVKQKLASFVTQREDFLRDNRPAVRTRLLAILGRFNDQSSLDRALEFIFKPLEELGMAEYFRGKNGASPHS